MNINGAQVKNLNISWNRVMVNLCRSNLFDINMQIYFLNYSDRLKVILPTENVGIALHDFNNGYLFEHSGTPMYFNFHHRHSHCRSNIVYCFYAFSFRCNTLTMKALNMKTQKISFEI